MSLVYIAKMNDNEIKCVLYEYEINRNIINFTPGMIKNVRWYWGVIAANRFVGYHGQRTKILNFEKQQ